MCVCVHMRVHVCVYVTKTERETLSHTLSLCQIVFLMHARGWVVCSHDFEKWRLHELRLEAPHVEE